MSYAGVFTDKNNTDHPITSTLYGTCATAANEAAKVVVCTDFDTLLPGVTIRVKFSNGNTAANPTININSTGAKSVFRFGSTAPVGAGSWEAGAVVELTYDGTSFFMTNSDNIAAKQNVTDNTLQTTAKDVPGAINELKSGLINQTARSISNITSRLTNLATAVAEQNLEKYGYKIGDYFTGASGYIYHLADMDTFYGGYNNNAIVNTHHISLVVKTGANSKWAETNDTSGGYKTSTLHSFLSSTVLDNIKSDMIALFGGSTGLEHLVSHKLLWTTATSGAWAWSDNAEYISALSEPQVYGTNVWAIDGYQTGEAWKWLEIFHKFNFCEILGNIWLWLRSISSASDACYANINGNASINSASTSYGAVGLIIFH